MSAESETLASRFEGLLADLKASQRIEVLNWEQVGLQDQHNPQERTGLSLAPPLPECTLPFSRWAVHWETTGGGASTVTGGEILLTDLNATASQEIDLVTEYTPVGEREILRTLRVVDDQPLGGNGTFAALRLVDGRLEPEVWFYDLKLGLHAMVLDYCAYLDALLHTKGFYGWQYLFAEVDLDAQEYGILLQRLSRTIRVLPTLFPNSNFEDLAERLSARHRTGPRHGSPE